MPTGFNVTMKKLYREDLYTLEKYAQVRRDFREQVMQHKLNRRIEIGPHITLYFEDRTTIQYQIQEMLRVEKIFEPAGIQEELDAYNPLIPDGTNLKATMMIEYEDPGERAERLGQMVGIERRLWLKAGSLESVAPIADEDLQRATETKTSAVHFLRFEFTGDMITALRAGAALAAGVEHEVYSAVVDPVPDNVRQSLVKDFD